MSKKNLSRTIIEGGRRSGNKYDRYDSTASERRCVRDFCRKVEVDSEEAFGSDVEPRYFVYKEFNDKLSAAMAWLESNVGERWDDVYSKLKYRFDTRTIAGQHIVKDHMLGVVAVNPCDPLADYARFTVDEDGVLRGKARRERSWPKPERAIVSPRDYKRWADGRTVINRGTVRFWTARGDGKWVGCDVYNCFREHRTETALKQIPGTTHQRDYYGKNVIELPRASGDGIDIFVVVKCRQCYVYAGTSAQGDRFSVEDEKMWAKLTYQQRNDLLVDWQRKKNY